MKSEPIKSLVAVYKGDKIPLRLSIEEIKEKLGMEYVSKSDIENLFLYRKDGYIINPRAAIIHKKNGKSEAPVIDIGEQETITGNIVVERDINEDIDSPLNINCPNTNCGVGHTPLSKSLNGDTVRCEWCDKEFQLYYKH